MFYLIFCRGRGLSRPWLELFRWSYSTLKYAFGHWDHVTFLSQLASFVHFKKLELKLIELIQEMYPIFKQALSIDDFSSINETLDQYTRTSH